MFTENLFAGPHLFPLAESRPFSRPEGVQWTDPLEHSDWDWQMTELNNPALSFFHGTTWAKVLMETYGYKPFYLVGRELAGFRSLLPLMEVQSSLTGKRAIALPFTDCCDPLYSDKASFQELFRNAIELGKLRGWKYIEFRGGKKINNEMLPSQTFYGHTLDLPRDENVFFGQLKASVRRAIRKAEKSGVRIEISEEFGAVKDFYHLHCQTRKKHGIPPQPLAFFRKIHDHILAKGLGVVILARWKRAPIAGAVFFDGGTSVIYKFGASDEAFLHLRGNNLIFWEAIRWFSKRGVKKMDLGRTSMAAEGLRRFKLGWNAGEKVISYFRFCLRREKFVSAADESQGWHNGIFRTLPVFASRLIGQVLYRHWA